MKIGIFGVGKMGECVAKCFAHEELTIYDINKDRAAALGNLLGCRVADQPQELYSYPCIIIALHPLETITVINSLLNAVKNINFIILSTYIREDDLPLELAKEKGCEFYLLKIIGHYLITNNSWALISSKPLPLEIMHDIQKLGPILINHDLDNARKINPLVAEQAVNLGQQISIHLKHMGFDDEVIKSAITVAAGTLLEYPWSNPDNFMKKLLKRGE